ncbi:MAG: helix-turn-helix transcriptional regulator [Deltaproteobacteria bacterium]|nr:helix-turn-helix transcriptional regulator [Deltaproteobacteria bacterium]
MRTKHDREVHEKGEYWSRPDATAAILRGRKILGRRLRQLRVARHLTQEKAAEDIGIHPVQLTRIENAEANFMISTAYAIAFAYHVRIEELFTTEER